MRGTLLAASPLLVAMALMGLAVAARQDDINRYRGEIEGKSGTRISIKVRGANRGRDRFRFSATFRTRCADGSRPKESWEVSGRFSRPREFGAFEIRYDEPEPGDEAQFYVFGRRVGGSGTRGRLWSNYDRDPEAGDQTSYDCATGILHWRAELVRSKGG